MIIVIFASDELKFANNKRKLIDLGYSEQNIIFANSNTQTRLDIIKKNPNQWLFFMDHDCFLTIAQSEVLNNLIASLNHTNSENRIVAGEYANSKQNSSIQKAHNWIANTWLKASYEASSKDTLLLGGVFLVYSNGVASVDDLGVGVWGAEDKHLALLLRNQGFKFNHNPDLRAEHTTTKSFKHFIKRAYWHGVNDVKYFNQHQQGSSFLYWLRKIDFLDVRLVALVALHFFVQRVAKIFQTIRQLNK